jgi:uncharacterized membrane protein
MTGSTAHPTTPHRRPPARRAPDVRGLRRTALAVLLAASALAALPGQAGAAPATGTTACGYSRADLYPAGEPNAGAVALNARGQALVATSVVGSFVWTAGRRTVLPFAGIALNGNGLVAGNAYADDGRGGVRPDAMLWDGSRVRTLRTGATVTDLNDAGQALLLLAGPDLDARPAGTALVTAGSTTPVSGPGGTPIFGRRLGAAGQVQADDGYQSPPAHSYLWQQGRVVELGGPRYSRIWVWGANRRGDVVGTAFPRTGNPVDVLWAGGRITELPGLNTTAVNDLDQVAGWVGPDDRARAAIWDAGRLTVLNTPAGRVSLAGRINDKGQVAGTVEAPDGTRDPFVWSAGRLSVLRDGTGDTPAVTAINDAGQVLANVSPFRRGPYGVALWTPSAACRS